MARDGAEAVEVLERRVVGRRPEVVDQDAARRRRGARRGGRRRAAAVGRSRFQGLSWLPIEPKRQVIRKASPVDCRRLGKRSHRRGRGCGRGCHGAVHLLGVGLGRRHRHGGNGGAVSRQSLPAWRSWCSTGSCGRPRLGWRPCGGSALWSCLRARRRERRGRLMSRPLAVALSGLRQCTAALGTMGTSLLPTLPAEVRDRQQFVAARHCNLRRAATQFEKQTSEEGRRGGSY